MRWAERIVLVLILLTAVNLTISAILVWWLGRKEKKYARNHFEATERFRNGL